MIPTYNPPYNSPIENDFAYHFANKYAADNINMIPQAEVSTLCGNFILDFLLCTSKGQRVGIECDGKEFHDAARDEWRDALILGENHVDVIYRVRGSDITYHIEDILYLLSRLEPDLFSQRGKINLERLATQEALDVNCDPDESVYMILSYMDDNFASLIMEARRRIVPNGKRSFLQNIYRYAVTQGGGKLDEVIARYRRSNR